MTRRILLVLLAFTAVVIAGAMVPLALNTISHDRSSFIQETEDAVSTDAAVARGRLETGPYGPLVELLGQVREAGYGLMIVQSTRNQVMGMSVADQGMPRGNWAQLAAAADQPVGPRPSGQAGQARQPVPEVTGSWVAAAIPVYSTNAQLIGTVILVRPTGPLNHDIVELWVIFGTVAVVAMLAAALLAFALARWVSRPLAGLDSAAGRLADGDLAIRAVVDSGPPELRRLGTTFNTMAGRLEALVHGNRAVIADVSHQLRTPLAALRLRLDLLAADTDAATGHELAGALDELAGCPGWWTACSRWRGPKTSCRCPPRWTWPRWPGNGSWRGTRWPTTGASRSRPREWAAPGRAHRCWPGSARVTWSRSWTT